MRLVGERATEAAGARLAAALGPGDLVLLDGELGAGKTTLVRGLAAALGIAAGEVRSPTFVLHHAHTGRDLRLHHLDAWRLGAGAALPDDVDLEGMLDDGAVVIEWGGLVELPGVPALHLRLEAPDPEHRLLTVVGAGEPRLLAALSGGDR